MGYLTAQIIICLFIAALIGFIIGWLLRGIGCNNQLEYQHPIDAASAANALSSVAAVTSRSPAEDDFEPLMGIQAIYHRIERVEGIGSSLANHLRNIGVKTTDDLIKKCSTEGGFQEVLKASGVADSVLTQWVCMSDLMRVPGVDGQIAELMEASGIKSAYDLSQTDANALTTKMQIVNQREHRIPDSISLPDLHQVAHWIGDAKNIA